MKIKNGLFLLLLPLKVCSTVQENEKTPTFLDDEDQGEDISFYKYANLVIKHGEKYINDSFLAVDSKKEVSDMFLLTRLHNKNDSFDYILNKKTEFLSIGEGDKLKWLVEEHAKPWVIEITAHENMRIRLKNGLKCLAVRDNVLVVEDCKKSLIVTNAKGQNFQPFLKPPEIFIKKLKSIVEANEYDRVGEDVCKKIISDETVSESKKSDKQNKNAVGIKNSSDSKSAESDTKNGEGSKKTENDEEKSHGVVNKMDSWAEHEKIDEAIEKLKIQIHNLENKVEKKIGKD